MRGLFRWTAPAFSGAVLAALLAGCASSDHPPLPRAEPAEPFTTDPEAYRYLIGPGDELQIFVWRNPEVSQGVTVRPDGFISTPLVEDLQVSNKTPTQVARELEEVLATYIRDPIVTVIVGGFRGPYAEQVRVVGEAATPQSLSYRADMTLLDLMIAVGGLTEFADGDRASIVRIVDGEQKQFNVRLDSLLQDGDIDANAAVLPGDILIVPEAWF